MYKIKNAPMTKKKITEKKTFIKKLTWSLASGVVAQPIERHTPQLSGPMKATGDLSTLSFKLL